MCLGSPWTWDINFKDKIKPIEKVTRKTFIKNSQILGLLTPLPEMNAVQVGHLLDVNSHEGNVKRIKKYSTRKLSAFDECTIKVVQSQSANDSCN